MWAIIERWPTLENACLVYNEQTGNNMLFATEQEAFDYSLMMQDPLVIKIK